MMNKDQETCDRLNKNIANFSNSSLKSLYDRFDLSQKVVTNFTMDIIKNNYKKSRILRFRNHRGQRVKIKVK